VILAGAGALAGAAAPAGADWLVMRDGGKVETKGPWKVDGRRVLFSQLNGTLSMLRTEEVDLDRSAIETARAVEAAAAVPAPEPKRAPVLVLTEKDLPPVREADLAEEAAAATPPTTLNVVSWEKIETAGGEGVEIFGTVQNTGTDAVTAPRIMVMIYAEDGGLMATAEGTVNAGAVPPGKSANFRAAFPGVPDFADVKFDVQGNLYKTQPPPPAEGEELLEEPEPEAEDQGDQAMS